MLEEDSTLLRRYASEKSEAAFAELVQRHLALVYSVALRQVAGDVHLAEDVTQQVFTALARKAAALAERPALSGWLYRSTHFAASDVVRRERRRRARDQEAHIMHELTSAPESAFEWERARPTIDAAIAELSERDRDAVALRFFSGCSFADIGARLRLSENTARMRVERALDKLHAVLARRGVTSTTAALGIALANQAGAAVPVGLVASVTGVALAGAAGGGSAWLTIFTMSKLKVGIVGTLLLAGLATVAVEANMNRELRAEIGSLQIASGGAAQLRSESRQLNAELQRAAAANPDADELVQLRARAALLRSRPDGVTDEQMRPASAWHKVGYATPAAANETNLWAATNGEMDELMQGYVLSDEMKTSLDSFYAKQSDVVRARYRTPERLLAELWWKGPQDSLPVAYQVIGEKRAFKSEIDETALQVWFRRSTGEEKGVNIRLQRGPAGWGFATGDYKEEQWAKLAARIDPVTGEVNGGK